MIDKLNGRSELSDIEKSYRQSNNRLLLLDYDGTLSPYAPTPMQAMPTKDTLLILEKLSTDPHNTVIISSGRDRKTLDNWFGQLAAQLIAEHGAFEKFSNSWITKVKVDPSWKPRIRALMETYLQKNIGALIDEKDTALVIHYRNAIDPSAAKQAAIEFYKSLKTEADELGLRTTHADMAIEIRQDDIDKGRSAFAHIDKNKYDFILCAGDSETDEDMFKHLKDKAFCIKVGPGKTVANYRVDSPEALLAFLEKLQITH